MCGVLGRRLQCALNHLSQLRVTHHARPARAILIGQSSNPGLRKTTTPFANRLLVSPEPFGSLVLCAPSAHSNTIRQRPYSDCGAL